MVYEFAAVGGGITQILAEPVNRGARIRHLNMGDIDPRAGLRQVYDFVMSWLREACYFISTGKQICLDLIFGSPVEYVTPGAQDNHWASGNKGLYVAIHGLNGRPNIWRHQLSLIRERQPDYEIRLPHVPERGNCPLADSVAPIEELVRDYIQQHPGNPVCLLGVSNGARIAMELEVRLRDTKVPVKVSAVAGALSGTRQMNLLRTLGLANRIYHRAIVEDMVYQSAASRSLLDRVRQARPGDLERAYDFFASPNDFTLQPYTGSLPVIPGEKVKHFFVPGEQHNSIVGRVAETQVRQCASWMEAWAPISEQRPM